MCLVRGPGENAMNRFDIGKRIEAYRDMRKMSTQELARRIDRSQATISRVENGKQGLTFELLSRIAFELGVHPFALLSDEPQRGPMPLPAGAEAQKKESGPNLLANALRGGRVRTGLGIGAAADMLGIGEAEVEAIEGARRFPDDGLLGLMCDLYGLRIGEMRVLRELGAVEPALAGELAYLRRVVSHIHSLIEGRGAGEGEERRVLGRIRDILELTPLGALAPLARYGAEE